MGKLIDLTGQVFSRLVVIKRVENNKHNQVRWLCQCSCGNYITIRSSDLRNKNTKSCGCLYNEVRGTTNFIHGHNRKNQTSKTYQSWRNMIQRCASLYGKHYRTYGNRGIKVCNRWLKFINFLNDMGDKPEGMSLDRIDNDGNYEPNNCRWATTKEQQRNRHNNRLITINSVTKCLVEWCEDLQLRYGTVLGRILYYNWTIEEALEIVPRKNKTK